MTKRGIRTVRSEASTPCRCTFLRTCASADGFRPSAGPSNNGGSKSFFASVQKSKSRPGKPTGAPEVVFVEWTQTDSEQLMTSVPLPRAKIHLQLRRLNNERNNPSQTGPGLAAPDNATSTAIPSGCSRVLFSFASDNHDVAGPTFTQPFAMLSEEPLAAIKADIPAAEGNPPKQEPQQQQQQQQQQQPLPAATRLTEADRFTTKRCPSLLCLSYRSRSISATAPSALLASCPTDRSSSPKCTTRRKRCCPGT